MAAESVVVEGVALEPPASVRIYVGGLGAGVTEVDIEKTFSSLGRVSRVEFVQRSDSSRFAFLDFKPHSEKSLAKLFSTYNSCIWKGGKLKLEKAKEHYMDRLKREWAEDAQVISEDHLNSSEDKHCESLEGSKPKPEEKSHIRIFFPKLQKVKALPFKGTGRHRYSFQRVEVPPLPVNFCDCEEHSRPCDAVTKEQSLSKTKADTVVGFEELNVMNSVMAKLFSREVDENAVDVEPSKTTNISTGIPSVVNEEENVIDSKTELVEDEVSEEEDFVVNFGAKSSANMIDLLQAKEWRNKPTGQDEQKQSSVQEHQEKKPRSRQQMEDDNTALKSPSHGKKLKSASNGHRNWFSDVAYGMKEDAETPAELIERSSQQQPAVDLEADNENPGANNSGKRSTWVQKSSWRNLVGDASSNLFSISHILTGSRDVKPKPQKTCDVAVAACSSKKTAKSNNFSEGDFSLSATHHVTFQRKTSESSSQEASGEAFAIIAEAGMFNVTKENDVATNNEVILERDELSNMKDGETSGTVVPCDQEPKVSPVRIGEVCMFMRTAESQKQWTKAKTALNSYFKKKSTAESSSKRARDGSRLMS